jgi:hypothetical protein
MLKKILFCIIALVSLNSFVQQSDASRIIARSEAIGVDGFLSSV